MTSRSEIHGIFSIATSLPETWVRTDVAKTSVSRGFAWACTRRVQCDCFATPATGAQSRQRANSRRIFMPIDKGFDRNFATPKTFASVLGPLMKRRIVLLFLMVFMAGSIFGQYAT